MERKGERERERIECENVSNKGGYKDVDEDVRNVSGKVRENALAPGPG